MGVLRVVLFLVCINALSSWGEIVWTETKANSAVYSTQGKPTYMEDRYVLDENVQGTGISFLAIFDGHSSKFAVEFIMKNLVPNLYKKIVEASKILDGIRSTPDQSNDKTQTNKADVRADGKNKASAEAANEQPSSKKTLPIAGSSKTPRNNSKQIINACFNKLRDIITNMYADDVQPRTYNAECYVDKEKKSIDFGRLITDEVLVLDYELVQYLKDNQIRSGTTALIAILHGTQLTVANVGDSRGVMCDWIGNAIPLSYDHKPTDPEEIIKIEKHGGTVQSKVIWRGKQWLAMSRALGDYEFKLDNLITAEPDIRTFNLAEYKPRFLILASDGVWDEFTNEEAVAFVDKDLSECGLGAAKCIALGALDLGSTDNISAIVVRFRKGKYQIN